MVRGLCRGAGDHGDNAQFAAGTETMNDAISSDMVQDPNLKNATKAWSAGMAKNGCTSPEADTLANQEPEAVFAATLGSGPTPGAEQGADRDGRGRCGLHPGHGPASTSPSRAATSSRSATPTSKPSTPLSASTRANYAEELSELPAAADNIGRT